MVVWWLHTFFIHQSKMYTDNGNTHALLYTHVTLFPLTTFLLHYSCLLFLLFLNSSLFSAHVYFYLSVHGRSQRNDEAWETCSSPWQLYCKPLLSNIVPPPPHPHIVYICSTYLIIRFVQVSISARSLTGRSVEVLFLNYYFFSMHASSLGSSTLSTSHQPLPPRSRLSCLFLSEPMGVLLWSNSALTHASLMRHTLDAICLATTVRPAFMRLKISVGFVQFMGVFPYLPAPPLQTPAPHPFTGSCWDSRFTDTFPSH